MIMRLLSTCTALWYCVFWKKLLLLTCFVVIKYAVFIWIVGFQWLMQVHGNKYLQDYRRLFSSCKPNKEWPYIALPWRYYLVIMKVKKAKHRHVDSKVKTLNLWKSNYYSITRKSLGLKVWIHFFRAILQEHKSPLSSYIIYHYFYPCIFTFGIDSVTNLEDQPSTDLTVNIFYARA